MSERSSPTDFVGEMLRGAAEELGASALTLRSPSIISYKIFCKNKTVNISTYNRQASMKNTVHSGHQSTHMIAMYYVTETTSSTPAPTLTSPRS